MSAKVQKSRLSYLNEKTIVYNYPEENDSKFNSLTTVLSIKKKFSLS